MIDYQRIDETSGRDVAITSWPECVRGDAMMLALSDLYLRDRIGVPVVVLAAASVVRKFAMTRGEDALLAVAERWAAGLESTTDVGFESRRASLLGPVMYVLRIIDNDTAARKQPPQYAESACLSRACAARCASVALSMCVNARVIAARGAITQEYRLSDDDLRRMSVAGAAAQAEALALAADAIRAVVPMAVPLRGAEER